MTPDTVDARKAIEALRCGVPSRSVAKQLGTTHTRIEGSFRDALERVRRGEACDPVTCQAGFGHGKTHLLTYLRAQAEAEGFATSVVVIGPETPLGNPVAVLREISRNAAVLGRTGEALRELSTTGRTDTSRWADLRIWARNAGIAERFVALLHLFEECVADVEFRVRILEDLQGKPILKSEITRRLRDIGQASAYSLKGGPRNTALAGDRIQVLAQVFRAFGRHGLVVFFDEVERLVAFSKKQRVIAYEQSAWWGALSRDPASGILTVWFSTFTQSDVVDKDRRQMAMLSQFGEYGGAQAAKDGAEFLMSFEHLNPPTEEERRDLKDKIKGMYCRAYGLDHVSELQLIRTESIRQEIRSWITYWDLERIYPGYTPSIATGQVRLDTTEVPDDVLGGGAETDGSE